MKICVISHPNSFYTSRWLKYFIEHGHDVHLIATQSPQPEFVNIPQLKLYDLTRVSSTPKWKYIRWATETHRIVHKLQPDILHAHQVSVAGWLGWAANYHPFVVMPWGSDLYQHTARSKIVTWLAKRVLESSDFVMADSFDLLEQAHHFGATPETSRIIQFGVDVEVFSPSQGDVDQLRVKFGLSGDPIIYSPRVLKRFYRHDIFVKAIPTVKKIFPHVQFLFRAYNIDPPDYVEQLTTLASSLGIKDALHFIGPITSYEDVVQFYQLSDLVISAPYTDGMPSSVLEAFACGIPVITDKNLPSLQEWIQHGENGLLVDANNPEIIGQAIVQVLTDRDLYKRFSAYNLKLVKEKASYSVWMKRVENIYSDLANKLK